MSLLHISVQYLSYRWVLITELVMMYAGHDLMFLNCSSNACVVVLYTAKSFIINIF